jgi:hypothetical protein
MVQEIRGAKLMPWTPKNASAKTRKASTPKKQRQWATVANSVLAKTGDDGRAIREANAVVGRKRKGTKIVTHTSGYNWRNA